ncbi:hypothetical protein [Cellulomonas sp. PSBB021]|uniref:hypothetical protein n=1 Tax=Cellulomonas sp. PSBB021 TaxID=2003551 RepID=UPI000B8D9E27|nr:hypothetical protein [Cellulomonas sp. PSBB021]ASR55530.1 hypothetical protein CBP52_11010 [Cellulomonas sp. PSBB021]
MSSQVRTSNCSLELPVDVYWHGCPEIRTQDEHLDVIAAELMAVVKARPERRWSPYAAIMLEREFRQRLAAASRGELKPIEHVKSLDHPLAAEMFEIRWQHVPVTEVTHDGGVRHGVVQVRLLHAEPAALGVVAIGLVPHEKLVIEGDARATRDLQDAQIMQAVGIYAAALPGWLARSPAADLRRDDRDAIG